MSETRSAKIRKQLDHPVIDSDGHIVEYLAPMEDYVKEIGGNDFTVSFFDGLRFTGESRKSRWTSALSGHGLKARSSAWLNDRAGTAFFALEGGRDDLLFRADRVTVHAIVAVATVGGANPKDGCLAQGGVECAHGAKMAAPAPFAEQ